MKQSLSKLIILVSLLLIATGAYAQNVIITYAGTPNQLAIAEMARSQLMLN